MSRRRLNLEQSRKRKNLRSERPSLRQAFQNANRIAHERSTRRAMRRQGMSRQAAIAGAAEYDDEIPAPGLLARLFRFLATLALLPLCFVTAITLFQRVADRHFLDEFWRTSEFLYFSIGVGLMCGWFFTKLLRSTFLYLYVLGHELTHAVFVYACLGRVSDIRVSSNGGYILTNKSNIVIALSPYCVPFWSVVALVLYSIYSRFLVIPHGEEALLFALGFTWCFHFIWTAWMIPRDQPDLQENGTLFSLTIIFLSNAALLAALFIMASASLTWRLFLYNWANNFLDLFDTIQSFLMK